MAVPTRCFLIDLYTGERLQFQAAPAQIRDQKVAKIKITDWPGSDMPIVHSPGGGKRTLSFSMHFWADSKTQDLNYVQQQVSFLFSLMHPKVVNPVTKQRRVTPCYIMFGSLIQFPCLVQRVFTAWGPFADASLQALSCRVDIDLIEIGGDRYIDALSARGSAEDVLGGMSAHRAPVHGLNNDSNPITIMSNVLPPKRL